MNNYENNNQPLQTETNPINEQPIEPQINQETNNEQPPKKKSPIAIIIIVGLIIIIGIILCLKLFNNKNPINKETKVETTYKEYEFSIDGKKLKVPTTVEELKKSLPKDWKLNEKNKIIKYEGSNKSITGYIEYSTSVYNPNKICVVSSEDVQKNTKSGLESSGITEGFTEEEVKEILGTPTESVSEGKYIDSIIGYKGEFTYIYNVVENDIKSGGLTISSYFAVSETPKSIRLVINAPSKCIVTQ